MALKINIIGPSSCGKTATAKKLSEATKIKYYSTDVILQKCTGNNECLELEIQKIINEKDWILEGKYLSEEVFKKSNIIVWLHKGFCIRLLSQWKRYFADNNQRKTYGFIGNLHLSVNILRQHFCLYKKEKLQSRRIYTFNKVEKMLKNYQGKVIVYNSEEDYIRILKRITSSI